MAGSATPQKIKPDPIPAANNIDNQPKVENSTDVCSPPILRCPSGLIASTITLINKKLTNRKNGPPNTDNALMISG